MGCRFTIRYLPPEDSASWIRIPKVGRKRLGKRQGAKLSIGNDKISVSLVVHQGIAEDGNKMVARIAPSVCRTIGVKEGDVIEIEGEAKRKSEICVLAIDCSISMGDSGKIGKVQDAVRAFLDEKTKIRKDGDLVGCVGFAKDAWPIFAPSTAYRSKSEKVKNMDLKWGTDLVKPLELAQTMIIGGKGKKLPKYDKGAFHFRRGFGGVPAQRRTGDYRASWGKS